MKNNNKPGVKADVDVILIGAGIMSATLGVLLKELDPSLSIEIYERLDVAAAESSDAWNNAGTGHSAFCELNYTPQQKDGSVKIEKAVKIAENFEVSKQFWAYLVEKGLISSPENFINNIPHISFVIGEKNTNFLKTRYTAMKECILFNEMQYSEDPAVIKDWTPLVMEGRDPKEKVAATRMDIGTDVNFGALTRSMFNNLKEMENVSMFFNTEIRDIEREDNGSWEIEVKDIETGKKKERKARFVFIGAGGGSLHLLEKSGIPEGRGFGGFPVSGQWLKCTNEEIIKKHHAKVYGKAAVGAPPMSVPHLDTRVINGKQALLFGPYAGFSTKFLKNGSYLDLFKSIKLDNIKPMISAGLQNLDLTKYLIEQVRQSPEDRLEALKEYLPEAQLKDWELEIAGQRVQIIKKDDKKGGILEFGTEVVNAADGSIAALLGASPGASTAVSIMLDLLQRCFKEEFQSAAWQAKFKEMIPSFGKSLANNPELCNEIRQHTSNVLKIK
ncbi:malate/quinone oxidoreductase [Pseudopedobacter saltans DSM 12145]|uniref:Probable malate:quinone oxidoreductase n=1 Tax=Pseudopedobacter saltans (strain ATCC 51119 / DSM 12145 / JCM 21818 / CCUG 39354 / LMG 10337 / NBRC 100064 / NCIMB 13643) TaxID=762903 RepID=F0SEV9_PSESL|nr:malate:quinone oxidoreductase [Pseudopedobacter saltans]ADY53025.1 malate/quinone oxidoreductase [Pseudopedobacter saltans DSM 12145]